MRTLRRKRVPLGFPTKGNFIELITGALPYLWVGNDERCFACVPDRSVEKLRDMCNAILERRKIKE